ncbi:MAG: biopolymer transporter ExbD [Spirochaetes bacterium]|nr:biopolymer transporter ExbD [Spirochaetota bacterium]
MRIKRTLRATSEMNMASSSDIAFLLIIFFLVTSSFIFKDGLPMVLPDKSKRPKVVENKEITTIVLKENDIIKFNDRRIYMEDLQRELKLLVQKKPDAIVLLKIEKNVIYQKVIDVIDIMKSTKVKKLSFRMIEKG